MRTGRRPSSSRPDRRAFQAGAAARGATRPTTEREAALDRIQSERARIARRSQWLKRGCVFGVSALLGVGALQESALLGWLAFPAGIAFWWLDAQLTRAEWKLDGVYDGVFQGELPPPLMGEEGAAAARVEEAPNTVRRALLSGPGVGIHWLMIGTAVVFNVFL